MWVDERQQRIMEIITTIGRVEADTVAAQLRVSRETIRRDLMLLERDGRVRRVHGGAVRADPPPERPFRTRRRTQMDAKRRIGRAAATLIRPGMSCFVDAGTTTAILAESLASIADVLVITNSIEVAVNLRSGNANADVVLLGGRMAIDVPATHGELTIAEIARHRVDLAILSPVAVHPVEGVTYHELSEAAVARAMMQSAARTMLLADHTKLGRVSRAVVCRCEDLDTLVTDGPEDRVADFRSAGIVTVLIAS
jgi:DeoR family transcriptional regulator, fructose operon transcriptional repressor